jgi:D-3-phosphoglycerate dehydrogenase
MMHEKGVIKMKYTCLNPIAACGLDLFTDEYEKTENIAEADAVLVRSAAMHDMDLPENMLAIARAGAGVNNIPLVKCAEQGIVVFNSPGANANGVKELVIAGMLLACRDIVGGIEWVKENSDDENVGKAAEKAKKAFAGTEVKGKKLGVIGLGAIGVLVANAAVDLGMEVIGYDPYLSVKAAWNISRNVKYVQNPEDIYRECDFITIHVPLMDSTKGMISKEAIGMMKETAIVLNFARDTLVDETAMVEALKAGKIRKYVVDFPSPITAGKEGCIVIPHLGASTEESEDNCAIMAVEELRDYIENGNIINSVNYPSCDHGPITTKERVCIIHKNITNTIGKYASILGESGINISDMVDKSRGEYAYSLIDIDDEIDDATIAKLKEVEGVIRVRVIRK